MSAKVYSRKGLRLDRRQVLRYMGARDAGIDARVSALIESAAAELEQGSYRSCWLCLPVLAEGSVLRFGDVLTVESEALSKNLSGCAEAVLFCATLGPLVDRAILSNRLRPSYAVVWDAVGTAAIEQLCDDFCATLPQPQRPRFSPGYGDLPLETQKPILTLLDAQRLLGVTLTDSLLMTPCKSVTAFVGLPCSL